MFGAPQRVEDEALMLSLHGTCGLLDSARQRKTASPDAFHSREHALKALPNQGPPCMSIIGVALCATCEEGDCVGYQWLLILLP